MKFGVSKEVKLLTLGFSFIFSAFSGVHIYTTTFFSEVGLINLGFQSLILIYIFFTLFNPISRRFLYKHGAKKAMLIGSIFYPIYIISLITQSAILIYFTSSLLGIGASLIWTGQNTHLIRASNKKVYGANSGFFYSLISLSSALGILMFGFLITNISFKSSFLSFSIFSLIGFFILFKLKDLRAEKKLYRLKFFKRSIINLTTLKLSTIWFSFYFIFGLIIGIIPIMIKNILGIFYIGILLSLFYLMPILLSYVFGKFSDIFGRKRMITYLYIISLIGLTSLYFSEGAFLLIFGIILLALYQSGIEPIIAALIGDISTKKNLESLVSLFFISIGAGTVLGLILSSIIQTKIIYLISIAVLLISLISIMPLFRLDLKEIKTKIYLKSR